MLLARGSITKNQSFSWLTWIKMHETNPSVHNIKLTRYLSYQWFSCTLFTRICRDTTHQRHFAVSKPHNSKLDHRRDSVTLLIHIRKVAWDESGNGGRKGGSSRAAGDGRGRRSGTRGIADGGWLSRLDGQKERKRELVQPARPLGGGRSWRKAWGLVSLPGIEESIRRWEPSATNASDALRHCTPERP